MAENRRDPKRRSTQRGQSFVELSLVLVFVLVLLIGVVEFGFLINNYLHVVGGGREAARFANSYSAWTDPDTHQTDPEFYYNTSEQVANSMDPVMLNPALGDDIVITVITMNEATGTIARYPLGVGPDEGWSFCAHYGEYAADRTPLATLSGFSVCTPHTSRLSNDEITGLIGGIKSSGMLIVETYYNYPLILKMPIFTDGSFLGVKFSLIPDPVPLYAYTVMPMSSADPK